ncbi:hypothetical protein A7P54_18705 [Acinetobacter sp. Ac_3412]|uniref:hypothetical protein n=1 Tax=Acinetobacter TaxID=469 RepID=UPI0014905C30|nr:MULTISPECIES: hypothetical protein [Acinetobacter]MDO3666152.1 hypothetical protein [Acinetobacter higginsii]NNP75118.1 hypothetical protein [Acinetobacter sp. Ac_3412]
MNSRDDFNKESKRILQERVGNRCSNPECRCLTSGPNSNEEKATRIGVAAHITGASEGGPRFDSLLTKDKRAHISNGIWLCQNCAKLIDNDEEVYAVSLLLEWKQVSEENSRRELEGKSPVEYPIKDGWICGHCRSFVEHQQTVCRVCHADVAYSATRHERAEAGKMGLFVGAALSAFIFLVFPQLVNDKFGLSISIGLGLGIYAVVVFGLLSALGMFACIELEERKYRGKPPRFFRQSSI